MKVAAYIRTASSNSDSYYSQVFTIGRYCDEKGWEYDLYKDIGQSGLSVGKELSYLLRDADQYDIILVDKTERLTRNLHTMIDIMNEIEDKLIVINVKDDYMV